MKTHDAAKKLQTVLSNVEISNSIARLTDDGPDVLSSLNDLAEILGRSANVEVENQISGRKMGDVAGALKGLIALSKYDKQRWLAIIDEFNLPIELNPRASSRDIVGKVLAYLDAHPEALHAGRRVKIKTDSKNLEDTLNKLINYK